MPRRALFLAALAAGALAAAPAVPAAAQDHGGHGGHGMAMPESGLRADFIADVEAVAEKYMQLAEAMRGHYDWRPGEGVRSVGEVFTHMIGANFGLPRMMGVEPDMAPDMSSLTTPDAIIPALEHSFTHLTHAIARIPDDRLEERIEYFGSENSIRAFMVLLVTHAHEHLGQSIAYARTNGVVPPWSGGD